MGDRPADHFGTEVLVCPSSQDERATGATPHERARSLSEPGRLSYVYAGAGAARPGARDVALVYERVENHNNEGMHVLFGDGRVEFLSKPDADQLIAGLTAGEDPPRSKGSR